MSFCTVTLRSRFISLKAINMNFDTVLKMKKTPHQVERAYDKTTLRKVIYNLCFYQVSTVQGKDKIFSEMRKHNLER